MPECGDRGTRGGWGVGIGDGSAQLIEPAAEAIRRSWPSGAREATAGSILGAVGPWPTGAEWGSRSGRSVLVG